MTISKKKIILLLVTFLIVSCVGVGIYLSQHANVAASVSSELSPRAKEFLAQQRSTGTSQWNTSTIDEPASQNQPPTELGSTVTTRCFTLTSPFQLQRIQQKDTGAECTLEAKVSSPISRIVMRRYSSNSLENDSAYILRTRMTAEYQKIELSSQKKFAHVAAFRGEDSVTLFVFTGKSIFTLAVSPLTNPTQISTQQLTTILESLELPDIALVAKPSAVPNTGDTPK